MPLHWRFICSAFSSLCLPTETKCCSASFMITLTAFRPVNLCKMQSLLSSQQPTILGSQSLAEFTWSIHRYTADHPFVVGFHLHQCLTCIYSGNWLLLRSTWPCGSTRQWVDMSGELQTVMFAATFFTLYSHSGKTNRPVHRGINCGWWAIHPSSTVSLQEGRSALYFPSD
jgi:hypothetical protein